MPQAPGVERAALRLDDGREVALIRPLTGAHTNAVFLARYEGEVVVVKLARSMRSGLGVERLALEGVDRSRVGAPAVIAATTARAYDCLLLSHVDGRRPTTSDHYVLLGGVLAELHGMRPPAALPRVAAVDCSPRIELAITRLDAAAARLARACLRRLAGLEQTVVFAHGDMSPDNALIERDGCVLIDFERACAAPAGLDLGRLVFLLLLRGESRFARAALDGYAARRPVCYELRSWLVLAGLLITEWRLRQPVRSAANWRESLVFTAALAARSQRC